MEKSTSLTFLYFKRSTDADFAKLSGSTWAREDGVEFEGEMVAPWKPFFEIDAAQRVYEQEQLAGAVQTIDELCDYIAEETV